MKLKRSKPETALAAPEIPVEEPEKTLVKNRRRGLVAAGIGSVTTGYLMAVGAAYVELVGHAKAATPETILMMGSLVTVIAGAVVWEVGLPVYNAEAPASAHTPELVPQTPHNKDLINQNQARPRPPEGSHLPTPETLIPEITE